MASLWFEHRREIILPAPTGPFAVGRLLDHWFNDKTQSELAVWIWYPASLTPSAAPADYLPAPWRAAIDRDRGPLISSFLTRDLTMVHAHSFDHAAISPREQSYPVVILRGGASAEVANYTTLAEDLASHGYVVVAFDAPYRTLVVVLSDRRVVTRRAENNPEIAPSAVDRLLAAWTTDIGFALDRLQQLNGSDPTGMWTGHLDLTRIGLFGHSFSGAQAAQFCHDDPRCKAGIDIDGAPFGSVVREGIRRPFLFLMGDHTRETGPESAAIKANIRSIYDRSPADARLQIEIRGADHFLFSTTPLSSKVISF